MVILFVVVIILSLVAWLLWQWKDGKSKVVANRPRRSNVIPIEHKPIEMKPKEVNELTSVFVPEVVPIVTVEIPVIEPEEYKQHPMTSEQKQNDAPEIIIEREENLDDELTDFSISTSEDSSSCTSSFDDLDEELEFQLLD